MSPLRSLAPRRITKTNPVTGEKKTIDWHEFLSNLRREDELSAARGDIFSRICRGCGKEHPQLRSVWIPCGHAVCRDCADGADDCPVCQTLPSRAFSSTACVSLFEDENFSRECGVCLNERPHRRVLFSPCGHVVCRSCAMQIRICPFCRSSQLNKVSLQETIIK